jgi:uncharacterized protein
VKIYLDANAIVSFFIADSWTQRTASFLEKNTRPVVVSDFAAAEFSAVIARQVRRNQLTHDEARAAFISFDAWVARTDTREEIRSSDIGVAETLLRRFELNLKAPDAIHLAMAQRLDAMLLTFDSQMAAAARVLGIPVAPA